MNQLQKLSHPPMEDPLDNRPWECLSSWLDKGNSETWQSQIKENLVWEQPVVKLFSKPRRVPRLTTFLAEQNINYRT